MRKGIISNGKLKDSPLITVFYSLGNTIYQFLQRCLEALRLEFHELKTVSADQLMYVKEDLIIPHHYSFYDFIVTKVSLSCVG